MAITGAPKGAKAKCTQFKKGSNEWNACMGKTGRMPGGSKPKPKPQRKAGKAGLTY